MSSKFASSMLQQIKNTKIFPSVNSVKKKFVLITKFFQVFRLLKKGVFYNIATFYISANALRFR